MQTFKNIELDLMWGLITKASEVRDYFATCNRETLVFDTESKGLDYFEELFGISLYDGVSDPVFILIQNSFCEIGVPLSALKDILNKELPTCKIIAHNVKYDSGVCKVRGIFCDWDVLDDTSLQIHAWDPDMLKKLETRVEADFGVYKKGFEEIITERLQSKRPIKWHNVPWSYSTFVTLAEYSCEDVYWEYRLWQKYSALLKGTEMEKAYREIELPLAFTLRDMETKGIKVDVDFLLELEKTCLKDRADLEYAIYEESGHVFNIGSSKQLSDVLYTKLGYPIYGRTKSGAPSTDSNCLSRLAAEGYPVAKLIDEHSQLSTLLSSFVSKIPKLVDSNNILRCSFNADITRTGRLSSSNPNLQNQPNNPKYPVRKAYIPREGKIFLVFDYSQIEPRLMAHMSGDPKMTEVFVKGSDIYTGIATELSVERSEAKVIQLAISYGMGPDKLAGMLNKSTSYAERKIDEYKRTYNKFFAWKSSVEQFARRSGYVTTMFGSRRLLPDVKSNNKGLYFGALRRAVNTPIQGSAAQIIKEVMNKIVRDSLLRQYGVDLLLSVHDELVIELPIKEVFSAGLYDRVKVIAETTVTLDVPVIAELKVCESWDQMKSKSFEGHTPESLSKLILSGNTSARTYAINKYAKQLTVGQMLASKLF